MISNFTLSTLTLSILFSLPLSAQFDCTNPDAQSDLAINNVRARLKNAGDLWWNTSEARYIVPKVEPGQGPEVAAIFAGGLWIGGYDEQGNLKLAAPTYGSGNGENDYYAGPLDEQGQTDEDQCYQFDRIWSANAVDINAHLQDWNDNGIIDGPVPNSLLNWPGRGNPHFFDQNGFDLPDQDLAPFFDQNNDGLYDPFEGDYPDIKGADEGQWMVFNDIGNAHADSYGAPLGMEVHLLAYAYAHSDEAINNTTFYQYTLINKSGGLLDSVYAALWVDADLGCHTDDYIGCSPQRNLAYVYNMDAVDGSSGCNCQGVDTYCEDIPLVGIKLLDGVVAGRNFGPDGTLVTPPLGQAPDTTVHLGMTSFMYYRNPSGSPTPLAAIIDPQSPTEYYGFMSGRWRDGMPLTTGGGGYNPNSTDVTSFAFPNNPADDTGWSMCSANIPQSDPRMVIGMGPFRMEAGSVNSISFAVIYQADVPHPCPDVSGLEAIADAVHFFHDGTVFTPANEAVFENKGRLDIAPNPFSDVALVKMPMSLHGVVSVDIFSAQGLMVRSYLHDERIEELRIERSGLNTGMYFCRVRDRSGKQVLGKFLIE
ncbi:MAG: T9SS type A sorting domain-containing protein [Saprospiraceae bacterium]